MLDRVQLFPSLRAELEERKAVLRSRQEHCGGPRRGRFSTLVAPTNGDIRR